MRQLFDILQTAEPVLEKLLTNSIGMKLVLVPPGTFLMGAPESETGRRLNETPQHEVNISQAFYVGVHTVTQQQYQYVVSLNPSRFQQAGGQATLEHPIENVSWEDALAFCRLLSALPAELEAGRTYRLPTEAEWEYTCRAGSQLPFGFGASLTSLQANFDGHYPWAGPRGPFLQQTTKIGSYPCNNFGLCETHGNVWEWCNDWYDEGYYRVSPQRDPQGPPQGTVRVLRGGCWRSHAATCRSAYRNGLAPTKRDSYTGFRVVAQPISKGQKSEIKGHRPSSDG